jgi:hypothetical protein
MATESRSQPTALIRNQHGVRHLAEAAAAHGELTGAGGVFVSRAYRQLRDLDTIGDGGNGAQGRYPGVWR